MYHPSTVVCLWVLIHSSAGWISLFFFRTLSSFTNKDTLYENMIDSSYWDENWLNENFKGYIKKSMLIFS
jgi:hypothetical protein